MSWVKVDDDFADHPKFAELDDEDAGVALWLRALAHANKYRTKGLIRASAVSRLSRNKRPIAIADDLVRVGLWEVGPQGYQIHDFDQYQPVDSSSEKRSEAGRRGAAARWQTDGNRNATASESHPVASDRILRTDGNRNATASESQDGHDMANDASRAGAGAPPGPGPLPGPREDQNPTLPRERAHEGASGPSGPTAPEVGQVDRMARELAAMDHEFGAKMVEKLDALRPLTRREREAVRRAHADQIGDERPVPPRRGRGPEVQGGERDPARTAAVQAVTRAVREKQFEGSDV